ncbi:hypothetical protein B0H14DRAFT_2648372 [Mycena olivaceomarginata]|nr:hypothetical protein B0H14DRAFT_2648372 [Mycena olivaceomarginata]
MSNLLKEELQALKDAQLKLKRAVAEMKIKDILISQLQQNGGRKGKPKPSSGLEYDNAIVTWGKKFAVLYEPWITVAVFGPSPEDGPPELETVPEIEQVFKDPKLYLRYTRVTLYQNIPAKFHELIDPSVFGGFATNMIYEANELRSLQRFVCVPRQLGQDPEDTRNNDKSAPPTAYPPIFYDGLKDNLPNLFLNPVGPLGSLGEKGKAKPSHNTIGFQWKVQEDGLTVGSICFTLILLMFVIADHNENFTETGSISKIPYQKYYRQYKSRFMKYAKTTGIQKIMKFWSGIVLHGVDTGNIIHEQIANNMNDGKEANFALAMEGLAIDTVDTDEEEESFDYEIGHYAVWELDQFESLNLVGPAQQEPPASPTVISSAVPANPANVNAAQVDAAAAVNALQGGGTGRSAGGSVGGSVSETQGRGQSKGKGRGGRGRGHGQVIVSDEEPAPAPRRGACCT